MMAGKFSEFEQTPLGKALKMLTEGHDRLVEFKAFSREGYPAVTALVSEVAEVFDKFNVLEPKAKNFAKQSVGDFVGRVMKAAGYENVRSRTVPGKTFSVGALWKPVGN